MQRGILTRLFLDYTTLKSSNRVQDVMEPVDISTTKSYKNETISLEANNASFNNAGSETTINNIEKFVHIQVGGKARLILTNTSGTITVDVERLFLMVSPFTSITIRNLDRDQAKSLYVKAIYA